MKIFINKFINIILKINVKYYFLIAFTLQLIPSLVLSIFGIDNSNRSVMYVQQLNNKLLLFLFVVIIAPIFETIIYQFLLINMIKVFSAKMKYSMLLSIIIPAVAFGFSHFYSIYYLIFGLLVGIIYSSTYYISQYLRKENAFVIVLLIHSLNNLLALLTN